MSPIDSPTQSAPAASGARLAFAIAVAFALFLWPVPALAQAVHVVAKGQTLGRIAKRYRTTVEALREVNGLVPKQLLRPGLKLVIPQRGKEAEATRKADELRAASAPKPRDEGKRSSGKADKDAEKKDARAGSKGKSKPAEDPLVRKPKRPGFVRMMRGSERLDTQILTRHGRLVPASLAGLSRILRFYPTNSKIAIDPRLATLLGMVSDHFGGRTMRIVSGFRPYSPSQHTPHSNHNVGRAVDFSIDGVPNTVLRDYCRTLRNAGVGYYPNSTFVHLDARTVQTYWVDHSRPGERPNYAGRSRAPRPSSAAPDTEESPGAHGDESEETLSPPPQPAETSSGKTDTHDSAPSNAPQTGGQRPAPSPASRDADPDPFAP